MNVVAGRRVTAVVVTYRSAGELAACLGALQAQEGVAVELVVVDNASGDGTAARARALAPEARVIENETNVGYGRANNQVLLKGTAEYYAIVNPDAVLPKGALAALVAALEQDKKAGVASLRHEGSRGEFQPSAFPFLDLTNLAGEMFGLDRIFPGSAALSTRRLPGFDPRRTARVDWLQGSLLLARAEAVRATGGFDPDIFMYGEDMEWCWRLRRAGFAALYLPEPAVRHAGGASGRGRSPELYVEHLKSRARFFELHRGPGAAVLARAILAVAVLLRWLVAEAAAMLPGSTGSIASDSAGRVALFRAARDWALRGAPATRASQPRKRSRTTSS